MKEKKNTGISVFQRYLTLWVILCMAAGVAIGKYLPEIPDFLNQFEYAGISIPMAILIWLMIYPMMLKVDFQSIQNVGKNPKGLFVTWVVNWLIKPFSMYGIDNVRALLSGDTRAASSETLAADSIRHLSDLIDDLADKHKKVIFTMGKGGVGKTTIAAAIASGLAGKGIRVHLTTTDPAAHLKFVISDTDNISMSHIDEKAELEKYQTEVLTKAKENGMSDSDLAYIAEDLRSPCTQEIAVFRAFAEIVEKAGDEIVVIDTAPTGHTLLLLESTQSYNREIQRTKGETPESVRKLLPRLKSDETEVVIVTLPEATPVYEALRLEKDLNRANISAHWWVINSSLYAADIQNDMLKAKAANEATWINRVHRHTNGRFALVEWKTEEVRGDMLRRL